MMMLAGLLLWSSCETHTGQGAYVGATFGSILGSAIGGIAGGPRGSDIGTVIGMAGGAVMGASVGAAADQQEAQERDAYRRARAQRNGNDNRDVYTDGGYSSDDSGFDASNSGDDRIDFDGAGPRDGYTATAPHAYEPTPSQMGRGYSVKYNSLIEIRNARFIDSNHDGYIRPGEECKVTFEIMNNSPHTIYDVQPTVIDVSGTKHLYISPNLHVESIAPHSGVRYSASILAGKKLKDGQAVIRVAVAQGNREITSQVQEFIVPTRRR